MASHIDADSQHVLSLKIAELKVDDTIQIRRATDQATITRYEEVIDLLPPIVVYQVENGDKIPADGFHRIAAHRRQGRMTIKASLRKGTRLDAAEYAMVANVEHGKPLCDEEVTAAIKRMRELHADWSEAEIARALRCSPDRVNRVLRADVVRRAHPDSKLVQRCSDRALSVVARLSEEQWKPAIQAAEKLKLNQSGLEAMVKDLLDPEVEEDQKAKMLKGEATPVNTADGRMETRPLSLVRKPGRRNVEPDPVGDDVAERLKAVRIRLEFEYQVPSTKTRTRGLMTYSRESERIRRPYLINLGPEALDPGAIMSIAQAVGNFVHRTLSYEGWPLQERSIDPRPGLAS